MAISRPDGAAGGWWMSCLCMCQEALWALEMTRNALEFTHWALSTVCNGPPLTPLTGGCGKVQLLGRWLRRLQSNACCKLLLLAEHCHTATIESQHTDKAVGPAPEIQNQKHAGAAQHNAQALRPQFTTT